MIKDIVIVGGGTAGWLTAGILAADHRAAHDDGLRVTLVESPNVPILGVGEGTWPSLRDTLRRIGISETEFVRRCHASFKQGSRFNGWRTGAPGDFYFHPFEAPPNPDHVDPLALWRAAPDGTPFAEAVNFQAALCLEAKAPKQVVTPEYAAVVNYAYHLDAPAFAALLREHCTAKLGVRLITDDVIDVLVEDDGCVAGLETSNNGRLAGDLFVDCTGGKALLIGGALGGAVRDVSHILGNDRALAVQAPYATQNEVIASQTTGTALSAGWVWDIALQARRGIGYVYSSRFCDEDRAREELSEYLARVAPAGAVAGGDARLIKFQSGYREAPWVGNVVAIGMSQGFVEPLEASAIVMIELSAIMLSDTLPADRAVLDAAARRFNKRAAYRWERIVEFLKLHYVLSERPEPFWQAHQDRNCWPERLKELLQQWRYEPPSREDFTDALEIFPAASYAYVLYGMNFQTQRRSVLRRRDAALAARRHVDEITARKRKLISGLSKNRELIEHIMTRGLSRV